MTWIPIWMVRGAFDMASACASVLATTKSTPCRPAVIMLLTALPPAPPTPNTVMRGFTREGRKCQSCLLHDCSGRPGWRRVRVLSASRAVCPTMAAARCNRRPACPAVAPPAWRPVRPSATSSSSRAAHALAAAVSAAACSSSTARRSARSRSRSKTNLAPAAGFEPRDIRLECFGLRSVERSGSRFAQGNASMKFESSFDLVGTEMASISTLPWGQRWGPPCGPIRGRGV